MIDLLINKCSCCLPLLSQKHDSTNLWLSFHSDFYCELYSRLFAFNYFVAKKMFFISALNRLIQIGIKVIKKAGSRKPALDYKTQTLVNGYLFGDDLIVGQHLYQVMRFCKICIDQHVFIAVDGKTIYFLSE